LAFPSPEEVADCFTEELVQYMPNDKQVKVSHGRWFSLGTLTSSTTKTGHHDIAEILLKVALKHNKSINQSI
jgi:hypothetical protein